MGSPKPFSLICGYFFKETCKLRLPCMIWLGSERLLRFSVCTSRWGRVFLERTPILSGIQFTTHCIELFVVETKRFVGSFVHEILTRQTCGQLSSKAAESKRRALGNCFSERICYMFLVSKCRRDSDLGLCTTSELAFGEPQRNDKIRFFLRRNTFFFPEVATAPRFSKRKSRSCAQT